MKAFRKYLVGAVIGAAAAVSSLPASAQGRYDWSGLYIGGSVGAVWGNLEHDHYAETVAPGPFVLEPSFNSSIAGVHVGLQHQFRGGLILGAEAALNGPAFGDKWDGSAVCPPPIQANSTCNQRQHWLATLGPRIGWGFDRWMVYGTGGVAIGRNESWYTFTSTGDRRFPGFEGRSTNTGWFAGAGAEWAVTNNVILGIEYQHYELDSKRATTQLSPADVDNIALASSGDLVRARLSFKLGRADERYEPLK